jgi:FixJ family two-component response regulator
MTDGAIVYVVDDDASFRKSVSRLLRTAGFEVEALASAKEFLEHPIVDRPSCLVLDVRMPGPSGMDLQSALQEAGRDIPIVFMTGHGDVSTSVRAMKGGAVDFLEKPFRAAELLACVERGLARNRQSRVERAEQAALERRFATLTPRERDVLRLVVTGLLNKQIAGELGIAEKTVKIHRGHVMQKMDAGSVVELVPMAQKLGFSSTGRPPSTRTKAL